MWTVENILISLALALVATVITVVLARVRWKPIEDIAAIRKDLEPHIKQAESFVKALEGVVRSQERCTALQVATIQVLSILGEESERSSAITAIIVKASAQGGE